MVKSRIVKIPRVILLCLGLLLSECLPSRVATSGVTPASPASTGAIQTTPIPTALSVGTLPPARTNFPSCQPATGVLLFENNPAQEINPPTDVPSMRMLAKQRNLFLGAATDPGYLQNNSYSQLLAREFNMLVPEVAMKWENIHHEPERYDFSGGDALVTFARSMAWRCAGTCWFGTSKCRTG